MRLFAGNFSLHHEVKVYRDGYVFVEIGRYSLQKEEVCHLPSKITASEQEKTSSKACSMHKKIVCFAPPVAPPIVVD